MIYRPRTESGYFRYQSETSKILLRPPVVKRKHHLNRQAPLKPTTSFVAPTKNDGGQLMRASVESFEREPAGGTFGETRFSPPNFDRPRHKRRKPPESSRSQKFHGDEVSKRLRETTRPETAFFDTLLFVERPWGRRHEDFEQATPGSKNRRIAHGE